MFVFRALHQAKVPTLKMPIIEFSEILLEPVKGTGDKTSHPNVNIWNKSNALYLFLSVKVQQGD